MDDPPVLKRLRYMRIAPESDPFHDCLLTANAILILMALRINRRTRCRDMK